MKDINNARSRLAGPAVKSLLSLLRRTTFLQDTDLAQIMTDNTERLLNLPGSLPFFATDVTDLNRVTELLKRLHPVSAGHALVRLGSDGDGGYLVPDDLNGISACFSPGVSDVTDFELDCANRGMKVFMADASVNGPPVNHSQFCFTRRFIGGRTSGEFVTLPDWVHETVGGESDLLLQMDIEGAEYEAILATPSSVLKRFRIVVVEFHFLDRLFCAPLFPLYEQVFDKLLRTHQCVHIHPNNVCGTIRVRSLEMLQMAEFTFLRKDRICESSFATRFPHPLDRDNTSKPTVVLPTPFYRCTSA
jgi:methyltransferase FkbM-like protein